MNFLSKILIFPFNFQNNTCSSSLKRMKQIIIKVSKLCEDIFLSNFDLDDKVTETFSRASRYFELRPDFINI